MSCVYPTLEKRIVIALFVHMGMSCRKIDTYLGRSHTGVCLELRQDSSKSGYCARATDCRVGARRKMPRHDRRMSRSDFVVWADEKHFTIGRPNGLRAVCGWTIQRLKACASGGEHLPLELCRCQAWWCQLSSFASCPAALQAVRAGTAGRRLLPGRRDIGERSRPAAGSARLGGLGDESGLCCGWQGSTAQP